MAGGLRGGGAMPIPSINPVGTLPRTVPLPWPPLCLPVLPQSQRRRREATAGWGRKDRNNADPHRAPSCDTERNKTSQNLRLPSAEH
ncbi:hypothetical protein Q9966_002051 [Columba livia]|nr:hypothetical protein Q9966_002051 [Columba livia]